MNPVRDTKDLMEHFESGRPSILRGKRDNVAFDWGVVDGSPALRIVVFDPDMISLYSEGKELVHRSPSGFQPGRARCGYFEEVGTGLLCQCFLISVGVHLWLRVSARLGLMPSGLCLFPKRLELLA